MNSGPYTKRILKYYRQATDAQRQEGLAWYCKARDLATGLATAYGFTVEQTAGVIAVLSPQTTWEANVEAAQVACRIFTETGALDHLPKYPGYPANVAKADRILRGIPGQVSGPKVSAFYAAILGDLSHVVLDIWATRAARSKADNMAKVFRQDEMPGVRERRTIDKAYRNAAASVGVEPAELQAIVWTVLRDSGEWVSPSRMDVQTARAFYRKQIRERLARNLTVGVCDRFWGTAVLGMEESRKLLT